MLFSTPTCYQRFSLRILGKHLKRFLYRQLLRISNNDFHQPFHQLNVEFLFSIFTVCNNAHCLRSFLFPPLSSISSVLDQTDNTMILVKNNNVTVGVEWHIVVGQVALDGVDMWCCVPDCCNRVLLMIGGVADCCREKFLMEFDHGFLVWPCVIKRLFVIERERKRVLFCIGKLLCSYDLINIIY